MITGRVSDEFGDPITGARVQVLRSQVQQGRRRLTPIASGAQTDDTGSFRVFGLAPGEYYIAAALQAAPADTSDNPVSYAPTYYPGTANVADAQRIPLTLGTEQSGINFVLQPEIVTMMSASSGAISAVKDGVSLMPETQRAAVERAYDAESMANIKWAARILPGVEDLEGEVLERIKAATGG